MDVGNPNPLHIMVVVAVLTAAVLAATARRFGAWERRWIMIGLAIHLAAAFVLLNASRDGPADLFLYLREGDSLATRIYSNSLSGFIYVVRVIFRLEVPPAFSNGGPLTSMVGITALLAGLFGRSAYAVSLAFAMISFFGQIALYRAARVFLPSFNPRRLMLATMFVPSVVFWSSGIMKEALALAGLGFFAWGLSGLKATTGRAVLSLSGGTVLIYLIKPWILIPLVVALGVVFGRRYKALTVTGVRRYVAVSLAILGVVGIWMVIGWAVPYLAINTLGEELGQRQEAWENVGGGSTIQIGDPANRGPAAQVALAPIALFNTMLRPLPIEARNLFMLAASLEVLGLSLAVLRVFMVRSRPSLLLRRIIDDPALLFSVVFVFLSAIGVGLGTLNLGTLSRYRIPFWPAYAVLVLALYEPSFSRPSQTLGSSRAPDAGGVKGGGR